MGPNSIMVLYAEPLDKQSSQCPEWDPNGVTVFIALQAWDPNGVAVFVAL